MRFEFEFAIFLNGPAKLFGRSTLRGKQCKRSMFTFFRNSLLSIVAIKGQEELHIDR